LNKDTTNLLDKNLINNNIENFNIDFIIPNHSYSLFKKFKPNLIDEIIFKFGCAVNYKTEVITNH